MATKSQIRNDFKIRRRQLSDVYCKEISDIICGKIINSNAYKNSEYVLLYSSIQNEIDLKQIMFKAINDNKKVYLPKVKGENIEFYRVKDLNNLTPGHFNILEPDAVDKYFSIKNSIILIPGIAFSVNGARIGFGKGYYDRFLRNSDLMTKIGIAYDWQITKQWITNEFDINMDIIITEKREVYIND